MTKKRMIALIEEDPEGFFEALFASNFWAHSLETGVFYNRTDDATNLARFEDDSPLGQLGVGFTFDGDGWIIVTSKPDPHEMKKSCRFRMPGQGGGESEFVRIALLVLAYAIKRDNAQHPQRRE